MYRIFLVEDDPVIAQAMAEHLRGWGYTVALAEDFGRVREEFIAHDPHLVLLDIALPFYNGYHWCREIRRLSQVPIVFVSSASDNLNLVTAMDMGGDDFIAKPFDLTVLTAKIQALLRRTYDFSAGGGLLRCGPALLDTGEATLSVGDKKVGLTRGEYKILQKLMENQGKVVSRDTLMLALWQSDQFIDENTLNVGIARLRRKLEGVGAGDLIQTKKGMGYQVG